MVYRKQRVKSRSPIAAATIISEMKPYVIGRVVGMGLRVAGRMAGQHMAASAKAAASAPEAMQGRTAGQAAVQATRTARQTTKNVARGVGGFLRPFRRVGGIIWLEVTGVFFLIFVPVFIWRGLWPARASYLHGPDHWRFLVFAGLTLVFLYLGVSSFWRAGRK